MKKLFYFFLILGLSIFASVSVSMYAHAQEGTKFTVYGRVYDTDGTPLNGITVALSVKNGAYTLYSVTSDAENKSGGPAGGYYMIELANLPVAVSAGEILTLSASSGTRSASVSIERAISEPQKIDLTLKAATTPGGGGSSSSSGGGGGAATSAEMTSNIKIKEKYEEFIYKDKETIYNFIAASNPVMAIKITGNTNAGSINVMVEILKSISSMVSQSPPGKIYQHLNIWVGTSGFATSKNIKDAMIEFKVPKTWLTENNINPEDIVMLKWDNKNWIELETKQLGSEGDFYKYSAKTTAFSPFVISTRTTPGEPAVTATAAGTPSATVTAPAQSPVQSESTPKKTPGFGFILTFVAIFFALYGASRRIK